MIKKNSRSKVLLIGLSAIALGSSSTPVFAETVLTETDRIENTHSQALPPLEINSQSLVTPSLSEPVTTEPATTEAEPLTETTDLQITQIPVDPGRRTRSGPSYIGIGGNIGLGGDTTLGESGFAVISKIGLTRNLSARPGIVIGSDDPTVLVPVTLDFPISSVAEAGEISLDAAPYVGGGIAISTGSDSLIRPLISAGVDVPIAPRVTATAGVNFAFFDDTEIGLILGAGYNF